jgi:hypothetical protein
MEEKRAIDPEVEAVIADQKRLARGVGRESAETERRLKRVLRLAVKAIREQDQRAYAMLLRKADVREGTPEWERAWKAFHSGA